MSKNNTVFFVKSFDYFFLALARERRTFLATGFLLTATLLLGAAFLFLTGIFYLLFVVLAFILLLFFHSALHLLFKKLKELPPFNKV